MEKETNTSEDVEEQFADLPDSDFACLSLYKRTGNKSDRKLPIPDAAHTRNAMARFNQTEECRTAEVKAKICSAAKKFNIENAFEKGGFCYTGEEVIETVEEKTAELQEKLGQKDSEIAELTEYKTDADKEIQALKESVAKEKAKVKDRDGRLRELEKRVTDRDKRIDTFEADAEKFREDIGKLTAARETAISEKNAALAQAAKDAKQANKETDERARIQRELAELREDNAKKIRELAKLSEKSAEDAKHYLGMEQEISDLKTQLTEAQDTIKVTRRKARDIVKYFETKGYKIRNVTEFDEK